jgi:hypothetical protein
VKSSSSFPASIENGEGQLISLPDSVQADITQILLQKCGGRSNCALAWIGAPSDVGGDAGIEHAVGAVGHDVPSRWTFARYRVDGRVKPGQDGWRLAEGRVDPRIKSWIKSGDGQDELRLSNPNKFARLNCTLVWWRRATLEAGAARCHGEGAAFGAGFADFTTSS